MKNDIPDHNFKEWMGIVDRKIQGLTGMSVDDLPDQCYRDWFDSGMTASEAAREIMENECEELLDMED